MGRADASIRHFGRGVAALALAMIVLASPGSWAIAQSEVVEGTATLTMQGGFARLIVTLDDDIDTDVVTSGNVMIMRFKRPVAITFGDLDATVRDYVGAVRRDPDNLAVRFALQRKVTLNTMSVGDRIFVDLLPDNWKGPPPGLPQQVVNDLAERARAAERSLRQQRMAAATPRAKPTVRVRASQQPTFTRFVFDLPEGVTGAAVIAARKLTVSFDKPLNFDLADAKLATPASVGTLSQRMVDSGAAVEIALVGDAELRAFHEDKAYIVDLVTLASDPVSKVERIAASSALPAAKVADEVALPAGDVASATSHAVAAALQKTSQAPASKPAAVNQPVDDPLLPPSASQAKAPAVAVEGERSSDALRLDFAVPSTTPAALFRRADAMWLVLDWDGPIDLAAVRRAGGALVGDVGLIKLDSGQAIRMRLNRPQLAALVAAESTDGHAAGWTVLLSDAAQRVPQPLDALRNMAEPSRASVVVPLQGTGRLHRLVDPDAGDTLQIVTVAAPVRGMMRRQDFVEFALLETVHGVAIQANADDLTIDAKPERVTLSRPGGLTLSATLGGIRKATIAVRPIFDAAEWRDNQRGIFRERLNALTAALSAAPDGARAAARGDLARFYFAQGFYPEAKAVLDSLIQPEGNEVDPVALILHALASTLMGRPELAMKDLAAPVLGANFDSQLWRAMALAQQEKWGNAREKFKDAGFAINALPAELQRIALMQAIRASVEVNDFSGAASHMSELELVGIPEDLKPSAMVLRGRIALAMARDDDALADFHSAAQSSNRQAAAEGRLREIALLQKRDGITDTDALRDLETLSMTWRGDATEVAALQMLVRLYARAGRNADAFAAVRTATLRQPNSEASRQMQDEAAELFSQLYLTSKGDRVPPVEALAMFYENRDLTPIGRRGDELIRRLAERLVAVDLLDQASELLQYQVDHRLEGAARAQVAGRLATVYLMNRKPDRAIAALHATRIADLAGELRQQRLLLEARAQSDIGRRDLALDIISNIAGQEAIRLRSDIHWSARRWREASEQIELYFGERWRDFTPLTPPEKSDVVRAMIGYQLAEDSLGLGRFRDKFAPFMTDVADRVVFDIASKPASASSENFAQIAKMAARVDTLDGFLRDMRSRFSDAMARAKQASQAEITGTLPKIESKRADVAR